MKTESIKFNQIDRKWFVVDAKNKTLGRLSSKVAQVLRGKNSFGSLMDSLRFYSVPSKKYPGPEGSRYFSGGYNTLRHGSRDGGMISAIQIEAPKPGIREDQQTWSKFASALTTVVDEYYFRHIGRRIKN